MDDCISRQAAIDALETIGYDFSDSELSQVELEELCEAVGDVRQDMINRIKRMPSAQPEKEIPRRVLWSGWKGIRDTRYKCPGCNKPVRNDDSYCRKCGQKLIFPRVSFTPYIEGQKQETIVRWDDEE